MRLLASVRSAIRVRGAIARTVFLFWLVVVACVDSCVRCANLVSDVCVRSATCFSGIQDRSLLIAIYVYVYIYIYVYVYVYFSFSLSLYIYMYVHSLSLYIYIYMYISPSLSLCMYIYIYKYIHTCVGVLDPRNPPRSPGEIVYTIYTYYMLYTSEGPWVPERVETRLWRIGVFHTIFETCFCCCLFSLLNTRL